MTATGRPASFEGGRQRAAGRQTTALTVCALSKASTCAAVNLTIRPTFKCAMRPDLSHSLTVDSDTPNLSASCSLVIGCGMGMGQRSQSPSLHATLTREARYTVGLTVYARSNASTCARANRTMPPGLKYPMRPDRINLSTVDALTPNFSANCFLVRYFSGMGMVSVAVRSRKAMPGKSPG